MQTVKLITESGILLVNEEDVAAQIAQGARRFDSYLDDSGKEPYQIAGDRALIEALNDGASYEAACEAARAAAAVVTKEEEARAAAKKTSGKTSEIPAETATPPTPPEATPTTAPDTVSVDRQTPDRALGAVEGSGAPEATPGAGRRTGKGR